VRQELESSFKDIQIVGMKLSEIENKMKSLDIKKHPVELETLVNKLAKYLKKTNCQLPEFMFFRFLRNILQ